jgi:hypothetical protein
VGRPVQPVVQASQALELVQSGALVGRAGFSIDLYNDFADRVVCHDRRRMVRTDGKQARLPALGELPDDQARILSLVDDRAKHFGHGPRRKGRFAVSRRSVRRGR